MPSARFLRRRWSDTVIAALFLFVALILVYHANGTVQDEGDAVPSVNLGYGLIRTGKLSFDAEHFPEMFKWRSRWPFVEDDDFYFISWNHVFGDRLATTWRESGHLSYNGPRYYIVESPARHEFVSTFGPIPGLVIAPVAAIFYAIDPHVFEKLAFKTSVAKLAASMMVAGTAVLIFLAACRIVRPRRAILAAIVYGVASCAWAVSSQNIWQQTVNQLCLTSAAYCLLADVGRPRRAALAGFWLGAAIACRATGLLVFAPVLAWVALRHRRSVLPFLLGTAPVPLAIAVYNLHYFGSPLSFAQEFVGHAIAKEKTGSTALWQTPLLDGAFGLLASPSRGLLVFSPLLALAFWGAERVWSEPRHEILRPLSVGAFATMALQCKWFDWWGGWTFGYRPWIDVVPYLVLFMLPVIDAALATPLRRLGFSLALAWSVAVQALGAFSYDRTWNNRRLFVARLVGYRKPVGFTAEHEAWAAVARFGGDYLGPSTCDVDMPYCRHRLWSVKDSLLVYQATHFAETRGHRMKPGWFELDPNVRRFWPDPSFKAVRRPDSPGNDPGPEGNEAEAR